MKNILIIVLVFFLQFNHISAQNQPESPLLQSYKEHTRMKNATPFGLEWIQLGPTLNGSRVEAVQAHPDHPGIIYVAFGSGGLWKTTDNGLSWKCIFENMASLGIGDIAIAPSNPDIIYVGTGESLKKARNFTMPGTGIYRSIDGGNNWSNVGLPDTWHIGEIAIHPDNPDVVLVAAMGHFWSSNPNRGIFRSANGGETWQHVLFIDEKTGANDIVFSPVSPDIVYATTWQNYPGVNGPYSGVYKSKDRGVTWEKITNGITIDENTGRIGIAASYQDPDKAYIFVDQRNRDSLGAGEIYLTIDGGLHWKKTHTSDIKALSVIGWYFMDIYVNPLNDLEIYGLGVRLLHSEDGGKMFSYVGGKVSHLTPNPAQTLHLDHCELWINPKNPKELLLGNDGGLYHSYNRGNSWLHLNNIPAGEFYDIEIDKKSPYTIFGGTQDDATVFGTAKEWNPKFDDPWQYLWIDAWSGGDGCITLVDPVDTNTLYFSMQNGGARRLDRHTNTSVSIRPKFPKDSIKIDYNFITPYILSPHNSKTVYMAGNFVMRSNNRGDNWSIISPDLIKKRNHPQKELAAGAIAESFFNEGTLYVGTDRGSMWRTQDGGGQWDNISDGLSNQYIRCIYPSKHKKGRVYVQMTGLNHDNFDAYLYVSEDYGTNWSSITNNLPNHCINTILEDPEFENILYAGTYRGVYISQNRGQEWSYFGKSLPDASIADIVIDHDSKDIIIATHGRGIYKTNLKPVYTKVTKELTANHLFELPTIKEPRRRDTHHDVDEKSLEKLPITYWLNEAEAIDITLSNLQDSVIWTHSMEGKQGFNEFRWDLVIKEDESDLPYYIYYKKYLTSGEYLISFKSSEGIQKRKITVK